MRKIISRRSLSIMLAIIMVLAIAAPALAASYKIVTSSATIYSGPGQGYSKLGTVARDTILTSTGTDGNFTIVDYNGKTGYILSSRVKDHTGKGTTTPNTGTGSNTGESTTPIDRSTVYATGTVNVRKGPGTSYSKLGQLSKGDAVSKLGSVDGWTLIDWNDGIAYVSSQYLTGSGGSTGGSTSGNLMQATANVNVRSGPGTNYSIVGWLAKGNTITKTGVSGKWTKVSYNGATAYVSSAYLQVAQGGGSSGGSSTSKTLLAARVTTTVRSGPNAGNWPIAYLEPGDTVTYLDTSGAWYKVQIGSSIGYAYGPDMRVVGSTDPIQNADGMVFALNSVRVYSGPDTSNSTLGYLYEGESAARTGTSGIWTRISYKGVIGYVYTSQIVLVTGTGANSMSAMGTYMRTNTANAPAYSVPIASSSYLRGYLETSDIIYAIAGNSYWTKISVNGMTLFTETKYLNYSSGSGSGTAGKSFMLNNANTYSDLGVTAYTVGGKLVPIKASTYVTVLYYNLNNYTRISWYDAVAGTCTAWVPTASIYYIP